MYMKGRQDCRYWEEGLVNVAALSSLGTFQTLIAFCSISYLITDHCGEVLPWLRKEVNLLCVNKTQGKELGGDGGSRLKLY